MMRWEKLRCFERRWVQHTQSPEWSDKSPLCVLSLIQQESLWQVLAFMNGSVCVCVFACISKWLLPGTDDYNLHNGLTLHTDS